MKEGMVEAALARALYHSPCHHACNDKSIYHRTHNQPASTYNGHLRSRRDVTTYVVGANDSDNDLQNLAVSCQGFTERDCNNHHNHNNGNHHNNNHHHHNNNNNNNHHHHSNSALRHLHARCCRYIASLSSSHHNSACVCVKSSSSPHNFGCICDIRQQQQPAKHCTCKLTSDIVTNKCSVSTESRDLRRHGVTTYKCLLTNENSVCSCQVSPRVESSATSTAVCTAHMQPLIRPRASSQDLPCTCKKSMVDGVESMLNDLEATKVTSKNHVVAHLDRDWLIDSCENDRKRMENLSENDRSKQEAVLIAFDCTAALLMTLTSTVTVLNCSKQIDNFHDCIVDPETSKVYDRDIRPDHDPEITTDNTISKKLLSALSDPDPTESPANKEIYPNNLMNLFFMVHHLNIRPIYETFSSNIEPTQLGSGVVELQRLSPFISIQADDKARRHHAILICLRRSNSIILAEISLETSSKFKFLSP
ncbi:hypothetical protein HELRODRAFT_191271 [Helobdella robusta]|uniref:Uncharacterized protein n=1 Tax=Helobdella robusta TaxID=6412 RepID=T1FST7_HELRO|nr:hypothetical protein HELRODRAFT_191271 [Helobdella robusta]ESO06983.1 hypothetical protein HELRODRAFT_191271 [Helobdella robusta]